LELEWEDLALEGLRNGSEVLSLWHEVGDLAVEVVDLSLGQGKELDEHGNLLLVVVLRLELVDLSLDGDQHGLNVLSLLWAEVGLLQLVLERSRLLDQVLQVGLEMGTEIEMLWVEGTRKQIAWDLAGKVVLQLVETLGFGLVGKLRSDGDEVVVGLLADLSWGQGLRKLGTEVVAQGLLEFVLQLDADANNNATLVFLAWSRQSSSSSSRGDGLGSGNSGFSGRNRGLARWSAGNRNAGLGCSDSWAGFSVSDWDDSLSGN
jgi:hypothetical protein